MTARPPASSGWVLYDGECGFCTKWLSLLRPVLERRGFAVAPLQEPWVANTVEMPLEALLTDIRILTVKNRLYSGADAYLYAAKRIWWAAPFAWLFSLPGFHSLLEMGYRWVARNRYCIAGHCKLPVSRT